MNGHWEKSLIYIVPISHVSSGNYCIKKVPRKTTGRSFKINNDGKEKDGKWRFYSEDVDSEALTTLVVNRLRSQLKICAVN